MSDDDFDRMPDEDELPRDTSRWDAGEALQALAMERTVSPTETPTELTNRYFQENLPVAAASIIHLAVHSASEKIRLDAAKYVVERNLGKPDTASQLRASSDASSAMWEKMIADSIAETAPAEIREK